MQALKDFLLCCGERGRTDKMLDQFQHYMELTLKWNKKVNLTSITNEEEFITKHFIDSLSIVDDYEVEDAETVIDVGTGGGYPGVPLAIYFPDKKITLIDSVDKKLKIVGTICEEIGLKNIRTVHGRAEDLAHKKEFRETFDLCVSRAVANMATLAEYCLPFVAVEGTFIAYKGKDADKEAAAAESAITILGGSLSNIATVDLGAGAEEHSLVYIDKEEKTPKAYPRKAGTPSKSPL